MSAPIQAASAAEKPAASNPPTMHASYTSSVDGDVFDAMGSSAGLAYAQLTLSGQPPSMVQPAKTLAPPDEEPEDEPDEEPEDEPDEEPEDEPDEEPEDEPLDEPEPEEEPLLELGPEDEPELDPEEELVLELEPEDEPEPDPEEELVLELEPEDELELDPEEELVLELEPEDEPDPDEELGPEEDPVPESLELHAPNAQTAVSAGAQPKTQQAKNLRATKVTSVQTQPVAESMPVDTGR